MMQFNELVIHTDGGSRGNPGPAASAFVVEENGVEIYKNSVYLGNTTNNIAEYTAVLIALSWILNNISEDKIKTYTFYFVLDSELVVKQINKIYKVKDEKLKIIFNKINLLISKIPVKVFFKNVPRELNRVADQLVNQELDATHHNM